MAFLPNIPQPNDDLSKSQGDILNNFVILGAIAGNQNPASAAINSAAGFNWLFLPTQGAIPPSGAAFPDNTVGLYSAVNAGSGGVELYINKTIAGPGLQQIPMTASAWSTPPTAPNGQRGWAYLPSGLKVTWGLKTIPAGPATSTIQFASTANGGLDSFPGFSTFVGYIGMQRVVAGAAAATTNFAVIQDGYTINGFTFYGSTLSTNVTFMWYAIGL